MYVGKLCRFVHFVHIKRLARERYVVFYLVAEKEVVLRYVSDCVSHALDIAIHNVVTVYKHFAFVYVVKTQKSVDKRRFAASYLAHDANAFARFYVYGNIFEHVRVSIGIGKRKVFESDVSFDVFEHVGVVGVVYLFFLVKEVGDTL